MTGFNQCQRGRQPHVAHSENGNGQERPGSAGSAIPMVADSTAVAFPPSQKQWLTTYQNARLNPPCADMMTTRGLWHGYCLRNAGTADPEPSKRRRPRQLER